MAHSTLADVLHLYEWDWHGAEREYKRALELDSRLPDAHSGFAFFLAIMGRSEEAIAHARKAVEVDPLWLTGRLHLFHALLWADRFEEAKDEARALVEQEPGYVMGRVNLAVVTACDRGGAGGADDPHASTRTLG